MIHKIGLGINEIGFGILGSALSLGAANFCSLPTHSKLGLVYAGLGYYFGLKMGEQDLGLYNVVKSHLLFAALSSFTYLTYSADLNQHCKMISDHFFCSVSPYILPLMSIATTISFIFAIYKTNPYFKKWVVNNKEVEVFQIGNDLRMFVADIGGGGRTEIPLDFEGPNLQDKISYLKECEVVITSEGAPYFSKPIHRWFHEHNEICLLRNGIDGLAWQLFNFKKSFLSSPSNKKRQVKITKVIVDSVGRQSKGLIHFPSFIEGCDWVKICKGYKLIRIDVKLFNPDSFKPVFQPISTKSRIDERVLLSQFYWGVTLITYQGVCENHAEIVIEGINDGEPFLYLADFTGSLIRGRYLEQSEEFNFTTRSPVWKKEWIQARKILESIQKQVGNSIPFHERGSAAFGTGGKHNCFTWVRQECKKGGINIPDVTLDLVAALPRNHTYKTPHFDQSIHPGLVGVKRRSDSSKKIIRHLRTTSNDTSLTDVISEEEIWGKIKELLIKEAILLEACEELAKEEEEIVSNSEESVNYESLLI